MKGRELQLRPVANHRSLFLFGPRQTGKTTLLRTQFPEATFYNLLESDVLRELSARPEMIRKRLTGSERIIIIDEIQRLPGLLNEVHAMISSHPNLKFIMTGSSARNLRRGGENLLGGRAWTSELFPLVSSELDFGDWEKRTNIGSLPAIMDSKYPRQDLQAYVSTYLREEIRAEGLVRSMEAFSRYLEIASLSNGQLLNFTEIGSDSGVPPRTVREHFQLLEDTLIGNMLRPYQKTVKRKPVATSKFFLFDAGVANSLMKRDSVQKGSREYGQVLEHLMYIELRAYLSYRRLELPLTFWRSQSKLEVDFVIGDEVAIEVKASERVTERAMGGLRALAEEVPLRRKIIVCNESAPWRSDDGIEVMPVETFVRALWSNQLFAVPLPEGSTAAIG